MAEKRKADSSQGLMGMIKQQLSDMPSQNKKPRQAEKNMGADPVQTLFNRLKDIRDDFYKRGDMGACNVEIEAKLGLIVSSETGGRTGAFTPGAGAIEMLPGVMKGKKFVSGVSRKDFESFKRLQEVPSLAEKVAKKTHAYTYNDDQRIQTDEEGNVILEMKTRELEFQIHLPSCPYDCRITVSIEKPLEQSEKVVVKEGWHSHRVKDRASFVDLKARHGHPKVSQWQADFTRVATSVQRDPTVEETFEVELELKAEECKSWIQANEAEDAKQKTGDIARDLWNRISQMMPREQTAGKLVEVKDYAVEEAAQRVCVACFDSAEANNSVKFEFPGTMPIGFSRKSIEKVQKESYMVSEKTDGIRYLLACVASPEAGKPPVAVLLDRKFKAWTMEGMEEIGAALGVGTVLDGEQGADRVDFTDHIHLGKKLACACAASLMGSCWAGKEEKYRLLGDLGHQSSLITEWEYCADQGAWIYKMPRPDKKKPNFSRTVLATIMEIAEGMDIEELEYRLTFRNPEEDDWTYQIDKKRKEILATRLQSNGSHH
ncbi:hypothetical protein GUITHDRAFT_107444 [Guillardia theta CCMP2712]|uniref:mRNA 5'-phosphatase n=1 Tax=Guillardia theta (strain CCMP2712) TaxID=905079 RepID=L1JDS1_GUITC|nr:hypothetical protein GUITHDRAFT_107444 [Guillardia theta CCMP2712]EKX46661.1 hypothetical protein GUITHDRAFT_107444 [Guillardia theta CCMP2712]|eukprot:XP_005833641.1 hypothetical protein GUITHDRAFT_107444 [Guillardia theta CCMP2712]